MTDEEFKFSNKSIVLEKKETISSSYKVKSYKIKFKMMEEQEIAQKPIKEVIEHFFLENNSISKNVKNSISKIIYCHKDRIIIVITSLGKDIIYKRSNFIRNYGWFFFVSESEEKSKREPNRKQKKKREPRKKEITLSSEIFQIKDYVVSLKEKENMRGLYHTKEYSQYLNIIKSRKVPQMHIHSLLKDFFSNKQLKIPEKEKKAIRKIIYYRSERVVVVKSLIGDKMYENLKRMVLRYGWYFYITGVPVGNSDLSIEIDKIEKRFNSDYFKEISLGSEKPRITLYPIALNPNHNCVILSLGNLNILLDCGITEENFDSIEFYLEHWDEILLEKEKGMKDPIQEPPKEKIDQEQNVKEINELLDFEKKTENIDDTSNLEEKEEVKVENIDNSSNEEGQNPQIDAIFVSHSHYDHVSGLKDLVKKYPDVPILCSRITLDLYLLRDSKFLKQEKQDSIEEEDYKAVVKNVIYVEHGVKIEFKDKNCYLSFFHAGHMPGALMMLAKVNDFRFLFTGDYSLYDFTPFAGIGRFLEQISRPIDFLLIDATSAHEEYESISQQLHSLTLFVEQKTEYGDNTLIGADPSSLAITFMLTFWRYFRKLQLRRNYTKRPNIYVDKMVRKNIQVINHRYEYIYGPISKLIRDKANPFNSIKFRWFDKGDLDFLRTKNNIIISHPPDLSYGIIRNIINVVGRSPHNLVFLAGALHGEPGSSLVNPYEMTEELEKEMEMAAKMAAKKDLNNKKRLETEEKTDEVSEKPNGETSVQDPKEKYEEKSVSMTIIKDGKKEIIFKENWRMPFRALLLNTFGPNIKLKLHADKNQLKKMIESLKPKEVAFFHQSYRKLVGVAEEILAFESVENVLIPRERKLLIIR